jgi:hypothetical protein
MIELTWRERRLLRNLRRNVARRPFSDLLSPAWQRLLLSYIKEKPLVPNCLVRARP